jgi:hypothetical protein
MEENQLIKDNQNQKEPRPSFLTTLCVLSFISTGLTILSSIFGLLGGPMNEEELLKQKVELTKSADELRSLDAESFAVMIEKLQRMMESINEHFYASTFLSVIVAGLGLFGVLQMWSGKKMGFQIYMAYSLITIVQTYLFVAPADIPLFVIVWNVLIAALFIFLYSRNVKWLE